MADGAPVAPVAAGRRWPHRGAGGWEQRLHQAPHSPDPSAVVLEDQRRASSGRGRPRQSKAENGIRAGKLNVRVTGCVASVRGAGIGGACWTSHAGLAEGWEKQVCELGTDAAHRPEHYSF